VTKQPEPTQLDGTAWVLATLAGRTLPAGHVATARFEGGRISGTDGCNRYTSPFATQGAAIEIGPRAASTQMACAEDVMAQAQAFFASLTAARRYRVAEGRLELLGADGSALAAFVAQPQSLAGTSWRATAINNGREAVVSLVADTSVTLAFAADGRASGSAGCNAYTSTWKSEGGGLSFGPAAATRKHCAAAGVMEQEQAFLAALASVATMHFEADRLDLRTAKGALAATFTRVPAN
jgi:heat shock protein HslJ